MMRVTKAEKTIINNIVEMVNIILDLISSVVTLDSGLERLNNERFTFSKAWRRVKYYKKKVDAQIKGPITQLFSIPDSHFVTITEARKQLGYITRSLNRSVKKIAGNTVLSLDEAISFFQLISNVIEYKRPEIEEIEKKLNEVKKKIGLETAGHVLLHLIIEEVFPVLNILLLPISAGGVGILIKHITSASKEFKQLGKPELDDFIRKIKEAKKLLNGMVKEVLQLLQNANRVIQDLENRWAVINSGVLELEASLKDLLDGFKRST